MRKFLLSIVILFISVAAIQAQDTTFTKPNISKKVKDRIGKSKDRLVIDLCMMNAIIKKDNAFVPKDFKLQGFNRGINIYFMYGFGLGKKKNFSIAPGIGFANENYYFKKYRLDWHKDSITRFVPFGDSIASKTSSLGLTYLDIPIEVRYISKQSSKTGMSWKLAVGFKIGFLIGSKWKYKGEDWEANDGENIKMRDFKVGNLSKFRYGVTLRGGYGPVSLFGYYSLGNIFVKNKGPQFNPVVFGISINGL
ncbi:MAG TPA: porin family protein [Chitinophagales bacterium]|nr:PorT family protein [Saprospirales bacterium]HUM51437.1 porin family protein [Chitinophagales bacterium]